jgi:hypothetical protein
LSILESSRHELRIAHGLTRMTPSPCGWEAFPTLGAPTHTRITWAFSPSAPQVPLEKRTSPKYIYILICLVSKSAQWRLRQFGLKQRCLSLMLWLERGSKSNLVSCIKDASQESVGCISTLTTRGIINHVTLAGPYNL